MKLLVVSTGDVNGAYEAAYRITKIALDSNIEAALLVKHKTRGDFFIISVPNSPIRRKKGLGKKILKKFRLLPQDYIRPITDPKYLFLDEDETVNCISGATLLSYVSFKPDIILVGMCPGFINSNTLAEIKSILDVKIYYLMTDMAPMTGGCHYAWDCEGYKFDCKNCPAILNHKDKNWPHENLMIKHKNISSADIQVIAMSGWTLMQTKHSYLFNGQKNIFNINSCIDTTLFNNKNRNVAKQIFDLPETCKVIFTGSQSINDPRKGVEYFIDALNIFWSKAEDKVRRNVYILIAGRDSHESKYFAEKIHFNKHFIDYIKDYRLLALAYQAADIFVCASIEDSGPMMVSEALACGTPVVGFDMGVVHNMVINNYNGYKAELKSSLDLALGMEKIIKLENEEFESYSRNAVKQVNQYSSEIIVQEVLDELL